MITMCLIITVSYYDILLQHSIIYCVFSFTAGPTVEPNMRIAILSSRDTVSNIVLTLSFNVTFGPPSRVYCNYNNKVTFLHNVREDPNLSREVIRSQFVSSSKPDVTRVTVKVIQSIRVKRMYICQVHIEGRKNIASGAYDFLNKGNRTTNVTVTGT